MLTVMSEPGNTFVEVVRCLTDSSFVQELLPKIQDPIIRRYWTDQIAQTADFHKSEVLDYIVSKFGRFVTNKLMRNIIGQSQSAFDFRKVMDEGKILLINLAKGKIGEENSNFLGLILVPKILIAAMSRTDIPEEKRRDFFFLNFPPLDFPELVFYLFHERHAVLAFYLYKSSQGQPVQRIFRLPPLNRESARRKAQTEFFNFDARPLCRKKMAGFMDKNQEAENENKYQYGDEHNFSIIG